MDLMGTPITSEQKHLQFSMFHATPRIPLELLTPPSSEKIDGPFELPLSYERDTPVSRKTLHRETAALPRVFNRKCKISVFCDEEGGHLSSIKEDPNEDLFRRVEDPLLDRVQTEYQVKVKCYSGALTPQESPKSKCINSINSIASSSSTCAQTQLSTPKKQTSYDSGGTFKRPIVAPFSPSKRLKSLKFNTKSRLDSEKENSPIKVDLSGCGTGSWFAATTGQPCSLILKRPPVPLILRSLGKEETEDKSLDILKCLANRNMYNVIEKIINYCEILDLAVIEKVSPCWKEIVKEVQTLPDIHRARKMALTSKENIPVRANPVKNEAKSRNETTPRKLALVSHKNTIPSPKRRVLLPDLTSPRTKRFRAFVEEGKALSPSKRLERCPTCRFPAIANNEKCAQCSQCQLTFCIECKCQPHPTSSCNFIIDFSGSPSPRKYPYRHSVGSKSSKKALRRLL